MGTVNVNVCQFMSVLVETSRLGTTVYMFTVSYTGLENYGLCVKSYVHSYVLYVKVANVEIVKPQWHAAGDKI